MARKALLLVVALATLGGCLAPPSQSQRVTDSARELNLATRFGRMDVALGHAAKGAQQSFLERRTEWGKGIRIVDVELAGLSMKDEMNATIQVDVSWVRVNDDTLRTTRLAQVWRDDGGWRLVRELRMAGDLGLFGEPLPAPPEQAGQRDVQFATKIIR
ncbi:MAG: hypothetical protein HS104_01550 [Polyangiaceae bacterium]|nr:hypothetical protein [Polyangiaceae bacterium]MBK8996791.1 hypothetical protein [Myxococcales bacterium]MCE7889761.1 hypothetical protein [Sorangiineae bacterium PRO1]MCL4754592.1 hypothetical protein [Myxococcales bacterium]